MGQASPYNLNKDQRFLKMKSYVLVCFLLALLLGVIYMINKDSDKRPTGLGRDKLPIQVSDEVWEILKDKDISEETWQIIEDVQEITPITIKYDPTRFNGTISPNIMASFLTKKNFEICILIYTTDIKGESLAHEALHAKMMVNGYPNFYQSGNFPVIDGLDNSIQHLYIFQVLESMSLKPRIKGKQGWRKGIELLNAREDLADASQKVIDTAAATWTLDGLMYGVDMEEIEEIIHPMFRGSIDKGLQIYEELKKHDLSDKEKAFEARLKVASILGLTKDRIAILKMDFKQHKKYYYDPITGELLLVD